MLLKLLLSEQLLTVFLYITSVLVVGQHTQLYLKLRGLNYYNRQDNMTEMSHYISFQHTLVYDRKALAALLTYYAGLLPADRKINTAGSLPGQTLSRIHHNSRQQPEVVSTVPDLVHLPRGDGGPLLILPKSVQLCGEEAKTKRGEGGGGEKKRSWSKCLARRKTWLQVFSTEQRVASRLPSRWRSVWLSTAFRAEAPVSRRGAGFFYISYTSFRLFRLLSDLFGKNSVRCFQLFTFFPLCLQVILRVFF